MAPGWANAPGSTDQDKEDARTAITIIRKLMRIYRDPGLIAPTGTFETKEAILMIKLAESERDGN